jgi:hypothetical protein
MASPEILVPLARPAIATMVILSFMWNWNEFLLPVVMISDSDHATAPPHTNSRAGSMSTSRSGCGHHRRPADHRALHPAAAAVPGGVRQGHAR